MKKLLFCFLLVSAVAKSDEGMWMPQLVDALNFKDMKKNGFKLSAEQIYSINKASMKDAVAIFGGGCTSEVISNKGLILTNHHCGFSSIAGLSTVQKDYLKNGYFAMSAAEELPCKGLTVTFIKRIEDVSAKVMANVRQTFSEQQKDSTIKANIKNIETNAKSNNHYEAFVRPFYYGNEYYLFVTEVFKDIRLVGTPPESLGKFGGETDNWVWPRHNADFSLFRIYAGKDNKPADYSNENVPYTPLYSFPISIKGNKEGDFTMVYGFPGRTQEYLSSYAVELLTKQQDPLRVGLREIRLNILEEDMKTSDSLRLMYTGKYANIANAYKKWKGEMQGLEKSDAINKKRQFEKDFLNSLASEPEKQKKYSELMSQFEKTYTEYAYLSKQFDYYSECLLAVDGIRLTGNFVTVFSELKKKQAGLDNRFEKVFKESKPQLPFKNLNKETDRKLCKAMLETYFMNVPAVARPPYLDSLFSAYSGNVDALSNYLYDSSSFIDNNKAKIMFEDFEKTASQYEKDPLYLVGAAVFNHYQKNIIPQTTYLEKQITELQKEYMKGLKDHVKNKTFYPDANGTLRVAYGKVEGYNARDAVNYKYYTTLDGLVEKNSTGAEDFYVKERVLELYKKKDFGPYADKNGQLRTAFIASNHTTGGNSGSPVLNAKGELIGTNFDRNWEGTMSDVMYNVNFCRNITLDVRFTLWVIDRYAGAGYLLKEMKIVK
ncbi:MAG: S46 family peptidase [Bacteroidia bacterium]|nr:S46 family peptidase [Bacteroidia bacterium]